MTANHSGCYLVIVVETIDIAPRRRPNMPNLFVKVWRCDAGDPAATIRRRRTVLGKSFLRIRSDLQPAKTFVSEELAKSARNNVASTLSISGHTINPVMPASYSVYVLELKPITFGKRRFYVGQTSKSVDDRIQEHLSGIRPSRAVRNDFLHRVQECEPKRKFSSKWDAESEETALGLKLIERGFDVVGPQGLPVA